MSRIGLRAIVAVAALAVAGQAIAYDRFAAERLEFNSAQPVGYGIPLLYAEIDTESEGPPRALVVFVYYHAKSPYVTPESEYRYCHSLDWLIDGKPMRFGQPVEYREMDILDDKLVEFIRQWMTVEQLRRIGSASTVEYRICRNEYELSAADIAGLRELAERGAKLGAGQ